MRSQLLSADVAARADTRSQLQAAPDLARALTRLAVGRGGPRDLAAIRDGIAAAAQLARSLAALKDTPVEIADALAACRAPDATLAAELEAALGDELPLMKRDGGFVRDGYDARARRDARIARRVAPRHRRAAGALRRRHRRQDAQDPAQQRARLFRRGDGAARRQD